jgi:hypothetical protein
MVNDTVVEVREKLVMLMAASALPANEPPAIRVAPRTRMEWHLIREQTKDEVTRNGFFAFIRDKGVCIVR